MPSLEIFLIRVLAGGSERVARQSKGLSGKGYLIRLTDATSNRGRLQIFSTIAPATTNHDDQHDPAYLESQEIFRFLTPEKQNCGWFGNSSPPPPDRFFLSPPSSIQAGMN